MVMLKKQGFTLAELMIVVAVIGVLVAIAYPNYQNYVIRTKRANMMADLQNMAGQIESKKMMHGSYANIPATTLTAITSSLSGESQRLYAVALSPTPLNNDWLLTATPSTTNQMRNDGNLTLSSRGEKCRVVSSTVRKCGMNDEWRE